MKLFTSITKELAAYDRRREQIIKASRDLLKQAKTIIFLCHEGKLAEAKKQLLALAKRVSDTEAQFIKPLPGLKQAFALYKEGSWNAACEEYLEAWFFYHAISANKIIEPKGVKPSADVLVGALADCTGELVRQAIKLGSDKEVKEIEKLRKIAADVVAFLLPLYLTGYNRQKSDQAKRNLKRMEEIIYEVKLRG